MYMKSTCINDLPQEILGHVFDFAIDRIRSSVIQGETYYYLNPNQHLDTQSPRNIFMVCKYWRYVALRELSIWTHLFSDEMGASSSPSVHMMRYWLSLSRGAPLRLGLRQAYNTTKSPRARAGRLLRVYFTQARRIQSLNLHIGQLAIRKLNHTLLHVQFPILDDLQIHMHPGVPIEDFDALCSAIHALRALRHLSLYQCGTWDRFYRFSEESVSVLPWERLETLDLALAILPADSVQILKSCVCATTIRLCGIEPIDHDPITTNFTLSAAGCLAIYDLPRLNHLTLRGEISPIPLLQYFSLPNLETLHIISSQPCPLEYKPLSDILGAQDRFAPKLQSVKLRNGYSITTRDAFNFIRGTRALNLVPDVSIAYTKISLPQLFGLDCLTDAQVVTAQDEFPDAHLNPSPARLMVWDDRKSVTGSPGPININIGWSHTMGGLKYSPLACWDDNGIVKALTNLDDVFAFVTREKRTWAETIYGEDTDHLAHAEGEELGDISDGSDSDEEEEEEVMRLLVSNLSPPTRRISTVSTIF